MGAASAADWSRLAQLDAAFWRIHGGGDADVVARGDVCVEAEGFENQVEADGVGMLEFQRLEGAASGGISGRVRGIRRPLNEERHRLDRARPELVFDAE